MQSQTDVFEPQGAPLTKSQARALRRQNRKDGQQATGYRPLEAKTPNQKIYLRHLQDGKHVVSTGSAGTGKTYLASRVAAKSLLEGKVDRIIVCRATVSKAKHQLGFLPGNLEAKLKPWLIPILDGFKAEVSAATIDEWKNQGKLEFLSFEHMRGRTLSDAFVILDEAQNCDIGDLHLFLTRSGEKSQIVVNGDIDQIDIPSSGLAQVVRMIEDSPGEIPMEVVRFTDEDVVRSPLAKAWVKAFNKIKNSQNKPILDELPAFIHNGRRVT